MSDISLFLEISVPLLALASVLAIAWARRQDRQVRRQVTSLRHRLERDLNALLDKGRRIRLRIDLAVELYCGGKPATSDALVGDCDELVDHVENLRAELRIQSNRVPHLSRRELRETHRRIIALAREGRDLGIEFDELDKFWTKELDGMTGARPSAAPSTKFARPVLH